MRILFLSDLYPPASLGGYEVAASEVAEALRSRGHDVWVLTTDALGGAHIAPEPRVRRSLRSRRGTEPSFLRLSDEARRQKDDRAAIDGLFAEARPEVVFLWNIGGVSHQVLVRLMNRPLPTVIYVFGDWPLRKFLTPSDLDPWAGVFAPRPEPAWRRAARTAFAAAARLQGVATEAAPLRFDHLQYGSRFMMDLLHRSGFRPRGSERVVYYGLFGDFARAAAEPPAPRDRAGRELLFVGRIWEAKGLLTLVEALGILRGRGESPPRLTIAGPEEHREYAARLRARCEALGLADRIRWAGALPRDALLPLYEKHDVLVFPSVYAEPFGIVQLEAMAAGCAVVGTATGGSAEILERDRNALVFKPDDAVDLAAQLSRLFADPALVQRLRLAGKETVRSRFLGTRMVDEIEEHLGAIVRGAT